jgi:hypothetical protein
MIFNEGAIPPFHRSYAPTPYQDAAPEVGVYEMCGFCAANAALKIALFCIIGFGLSVIGIVLLFRWRQTLRKKLDVSQKE